MTEHIAEVRRRHKIGGNRVTRGEREGDGYIKRQISVAAGGPTRIRSQIKPGRLSLMMYCEGSQCFFYGLRDLIFGVENTLPSQ